LAGILLELPPELYLAAFGGIGFLSFRPGRTKEQQKSCQSLAQTWLSNNEYKELTYETL
jgi:hypothetical protein